MHILSKSTYIKGLQCEKALYLYKNRPFLRDKISLEQRAKFQRGTEVGVLARDYFPGGINMSPSSPSLFEKKTAETWANLSNPNVNTMYEAVFQYNRTLIMLDILVRDGEKWKAIEVKSSLALSQTYYNDAAFQYYVLKGCGVEISDMQLMYLNADYVKQEDIDLKQLFKFESVTEIAESKREQISANIERLKTLVGKPHSPEKNIGLHCHSPYTCEFIGHCWKNVNANSFLYINALSDNILFENYNSGIVTNNAFERKYFNDTTTENQIVALDNDTYYIDFKKLYSIPKQVGSRSTAYLNLLLHHPAVPEFDGTKPYTEFLLAFSIATDDDPNYFSWNCAADHTQHQEGCKILLEKLKNFDQIICFAPQNINTILFKDQLIESKDINCKIMNLSEILQSADFYHKNIKYGFTLQHIYEAVFPQKKLFEHSRILLNAISSNPIDHQLIISDMEIENAAVKELYRHFLK